MCHLTSVQQQSSPKVNRSIIHRMRSYGTGVAGITSPAALAFGTTTTICSDAGNNCAVIAANQPHVTSLSSCLPASVILPSETLDGSIHCLSQRTNDKQIIAHVFEFTPRKIEYHIQELLWWSNHCRLRQQKW